MPRFVTIATFAYAYQTVVPKARLESRGILCFLRDEHSMYIQPFFSASSGIKLQVCAEDEEDARKILGEENGIK